MLQCSHGPIGLQQNQPKPGRNLYRYNESKAVVYLGGVGWNYNSSHDLTDETFFAV